MKFLSLDQMVNTLRGVVVRFPVAALAAVFGTGAAVYALDNSVDAWVEQSIIVCILTFFLVLALSLFAERHSRKKWEVSALGLLFAIGVYLVLPEGFDEFRKIDFLHVFLLVIIFILGIFVAPYIGKKETNGFWQYNKQLWVRILFTAVSSFTLFVGVALSLASADFLLDLSVEDDWYIRVWIVVVGIIGTFVFMAGIPKDYESLEKVQTYPRVLEVFSKYVLLPLVTLYGAILYIYGAKIVLLNEWPKGLVSLLVILYAMCGMVTFLFLAPLREKNAWVGRVSRIFYVALLPLIGLLFAALFVRISEYGLTESRVAGVVFGIWLLSIALYTLLGKQYDIRVLYFSFLVSLIVFSFGPVSAFALSEQSQLNRLKGLLEKNELLVDGKIQERAQSSMSREDVLEIFSLLGYLREVRGLSGLNTWLGTDVESLDVESIFEKMHLDIARVTNDNRQSNFSSDTSTDMVDVNGYDKLYRIRCYQDCFEKSVFGVYLNTEKNILETQDNRGNTISLIDFSRVAQELDDRYPQEGTNDRMLPQEELTYAVNISGIRLKIIFDTVNFQTKDDSFVLQGAEGILLLARPK